MSPAPVMMNTPQSLQVQTLAKSFEALLLTAHQLSCKEKALQQRLKYAHNEVNIFFFFFFSFTAPFTPLPPLLCPMMRKKLALDQESHFVTVTDKVMYYLRDIHLSYCLVILDSFVNLMLTVLVFETRRPTPQRTQYPYEGRCGKDRPLPS